MFLFELKVQKIREGAFSNHRFGSIKNPNDPVFKSWLENWKVCKQILFCNFNTEKVGLQITTVLNYVLYEQEEIIKVSNKVHSLNCVTHILSTYLFGSKQTSTIKDHKNNVYSLFFLNFLRCQEIQNEIRLKYFWR